MTCLGIFMLLAFVRVLLCTTSHTMSHKVMTFWLVLTSSQSRFLKDVHSVEECK
ncbi:hypothetical protein GLYMA_16G053133v4 [Glycine max]|nr:hypothetical protein GLYMA_16G053133v4 [Glycine max]KAH1150072.1 hypothetical protein GYH30_044218 [Glycine max]